MIKPYTLLAVECSATPASCAVVRVEQHGCCLLCEASANTKLTHSQTLLPMITDMLKNAGLSIDDIDALAVAHGPGSFTGIRIGVAAVKGLAFPKDLPCVGISTLEAMAARFDGVPYTGLILTAMDARCQQVYTALFSCENGVVSRLTPDEALPLDTLKDRLQKEAAPIAVMGDGAALCYDTLHEHIPALFLAPPTLRLQHALGVATAAACAFDKGQAVSGDTLLPVYLRLPQAERELRLRQNKEV